MTREEIVAEARSWLGTPFIWQQSAKGRGCDCKGLVWGVARELGLPEAASLYASIRGEYHTRVDSRLLLKGMAETFAPADEPRPGDVLVLRVAGRPQHLGIMTEPARFIHTYAGGPSRVVESPLTSVWRRDLHSAWTWRSLLDG